MASSASASLQLELMATGERSGQWGDVTNTNLKILEDAISGTESITLSSSDVTLTDTQFTFGQQSHAAVLELSGTLSANVNIIVPTRSKTYLVKNACTGAFTVTVKTASGTGAIADQGITTLVRCDGTNVVRNDGSRPAAFYEGGSLSVSANVAATVPFSSSNRVYDEHGLFNGSNQLAPPTGSLIHVVFNFVGVVTSGNTLNGRSQGGAAYGGSANPPAAWVSTGGFGDGNGTQGVVHYVTPVASGQVFDFQVLSNQNVTASYSVYAEVLR